VVQVGFHPHPADEELARMRAGHAPTASITHKMLIDTGAQLTVVEKTVPDFLGLVPLRFQEIEGVGGVIVDCPVYRLMIELGVGDRAGNHGRVYFLSDIVAVEPAGQVERLHVGLLGRDFLSHVRFVYDGPKGEFAIIDERAPSLGPKRPREQPTADDQREQRRQARKREKAARRRSRGK
jgi:hypothetical protein